MVLIFNSVSFQFVHLEIWFGRQDLSVGFECAVLGSTIVTERQALSSSQTST